MKHRRRRNQVVILLSFGAVLLGSAQPTNGRAEPSRRESADADYRGGLVAPPLPKPKVTLIDASGTPFDLAVKTQGYVTLLFFGYTKCPAMCPLEMSTIAKALGKLPTETAAQFKVVFVTTDPARDSPIVLRAWLDHFDKRFIGLTGSDAAINAAQVAANLTPAKRSVVRPDGAYEVGHAAFVLAYTKDNLAHVLYPIGVKQEDLEHDLLRLVKETWSRR